MADFALVLIQCWILGFLIGVMLGVLAITIHFLLGKLEGR